MIHSSDCCYAAVTAETNTFSWINGRAMTHTVQPVRGRGLLALEPNAGITEARLVQHRHEHISIATVVYIPHIYQTHFSKPAIFFSERNWKSTFSFPYLILNTAEIIVG